MRFSGDFEGFLKDLGSLVYKKKGVSGNDLHSHYDRFSTPPQKHFRRQVSASSSFMFGAPFLKIARFRFKKMHGLTFAYKNVYGTFLLWILLFQNIYNTQKAALGDVLMMKLVSYYEDKYKLTHAEPATTESITLMPEIVTQIANKYNVDLVDHKPLHLAHENNHLIDPPRQQPQPRMERNRRMERNNARVIINHSLKNIKSKPKTT